MWKTPSALAKNWTPTVADVISPELLRELLDYDPTTGLFRWLERNSRHFPNEHQWRAWNGQYAGVPALCSIHPEGYAHGRIFGRAYYSHRVAFAHYHNRWPLMVDHIDQNKLNNRIANLRETTKSGNMTNSKLQDRNVSGCPGVQWKANRWQASITLNGNVVYLGRFESLEEAIAVRRAKEAELGFSPLHGRVR